MDKWIFKSSKWRISDDVLMISDCVFIMYKLQKLFMYFASHFCFLIIKGKEIFSINFLSHIIVNIYCIL